ncbi:type II toxin-antitoxin system HicA family toxin [Candidatus Woesearchaeota archaeon]|nr:type II toxin-antitoxin system HicA family toxin [Candidatus Woesearchaeota archaeon]
MSDKLPSLKAKEIAKILEKLGFEFKRQKGSHMFFAHPDGRTTVVPNHPTEHVDRGLLNKIIKQDLLMNREEFLRYVK